jgi:hypothetical protein
MGKKSQSSEVMEAQNEATLEKYISKVDTVKVESIKKDLENYKASLKDKEYAVSMSDSLLHRFENYMREEVQWRSKEALGVKEILKRINEVKSEGIKDGVVYFTNLEVEASHYFVLKMEGIGEKEIESFRKTVKALQSDPDFIRKRNEGVRNSEKLKAYYISRRGLPGVKHTDESKLKISLSKIGKKIIDKITFINSKFSISFLINKKIKIELIKQPASPKYRLFFLPLKILKINKYIKINSEIFLITKFDEKK